MNESPLYWTKPGQMETECEIVAAKAHSAEKWELILKGSPFFPGGGGQPADRGTIDGIEVTSLSKTGNGTVHQIKSTSNYQSGDRVRCHVDEAFRQDSRQQHSGQHLISAALALENLETVSVHLGADYCGIEVEASNVSMDTIERVMKICRSWIREDRQIRSLIVSADEAATLVLRRRLSDKASVSDKPVRIVDIDGVDATGCGGVHLEYTRSIVAILFAGMEKIRGRIRLKWTIGDRVVELARRQSETIGRCRQLLSAEMDEIPGRVKAIMTELREAKVRLESNEKESGAFLCGNAARENDIVALVIEGASPRIQGALTAAAADSDLKAALFLGEAAPDGIRLWGIYLRKDIEICFDDIEKQVILPAGGRGGGRSPFWRGSIGGDPEELRISFHLLFNSLQ